MMGLCRKRGPDWATVGASYDDASRIMDRKSLWMVEYLRERRGGCPKMRAFYRRNYFLEKDTDQ